MITPIATTVLGSEKAMGLYEMHLQSPLSKGFHRYQIIHVVRDGHLAEFRKDMGSAKKYKGVKYIRIPSYMEYTVDTLMDWAEDLRNEVTVDHDELAQRDNVKLA